MGRIHKSGVESLFHPVYNKIFFARKEDTHCTPDGR
jgi:hypothetical protein